jgi:hypothetical protein
MQLVTKDDLDLELRDKSSLTQLDELKTSFHKLQTVSI